MLSTVAKLAGSRLTARLAFLLGLSIFTILGAQYIWTLPLERLGSPADILSLVLGLMLVPACLLTGLCAPRGSRASRVLIAFACLFLVLAITEYFMEAGPVDIPLALLWLSPALVLATSSFVSKKFGAARFAFALCAFLQVLEFGRSVIAARYLGGQTEPSYFQWIESASDLLVRAVFLLGFVEALRLNGLSGAAVPERHEVMRMQVAIFMYRMSGGGAQRRAIGLANGLAERGYDVDMVVVNEKSGYKESLHPAIRYVALSDPKWGRLHAALYRYVPFRSIRVFTSALALARYLTVARPRILVAAADRVLPPAVVAWRIAGKPMPLMLRATNHPSGNLKLWAPLKFVLDLLLGGLSRLVYRPATVVVAVSDGVADEVARLAGLDRRDIATIYEPVVDDSIGLKANEPLDHPWLAPGEPPVLLAVGHLRLQKDFPTLIRAFALARAQRPMRLVLLGKGSQRAELQRMIDDLGVQADVCLYGYTENPFAWMAKASMFVLSSAWEGLSAVLIEALACGCPVVSTDCPSGPREVLDGGKYGKLVPCFDPEALAGAILATVDAPVDREALRRRAKNFSAEASVEAYIRAFEVAITRHRVREIEGERAGITA